MGESMKNKKKLCLAVVFFVVAICIFLYILYWKEQKEQVLQEETKIEETKKQLQETYSCKEEIAQARKKYEEKSQKSEVITEPLLLEKNQLEF